MSGVRGLTPTSASRSSSFTSSTTSWTISLGDSGIQTEFPPDALPNHVRSSQEGHRNGPYGAGMTHDTFTRRTTLAKLGGVLLAAAGGRALLPSQAEGGNKDVAT